jgi:hypothetical protein
MTIREQINNLPEPYRTKALGYEALSKRCAGLFVTDSHIRWIHDDWDDGGDFGEAFPWKQTEEGFDFWKAVYNWIKYNLPEPPKEWSQE